MLVNLLRTKIIVRYGRFVALEFKEMDLCHQTVFVLLERGYLEKTYYIHGTHR